MGEQGASTTAVGQRERGVALLGAVGLGVWAAIIVLQAGAGGFISFWHAFFFLGVLTLAGSATRTIGWPVLLALFASGSFAGGIALFVLRAFLAIGISVDHPLRPIVVALVDQSFMLAPLLWFLWRWRKGLCLLGVTDVLLMAAACGTGFGFVEHAFVINRVPSVTWLWWMPQAGIAHTPRDAIWLINSHAVLAAIAGATIGLGLLLRHKGQLAKIVAVSGAAYGLADRIILGNLGFRTSEAFAQGLAWLLGWGWLTLWLFFATVAVAVVVDTFVIRTSMPKKARPLANLGSFLTAPWWSTQLEMRSLAFAGFRYKHSSGSERAAIGSPTLAVLSSLVKRYKRLNPDMKASAAADSKKAAEEGATPAT